MTEAHVVVDTCALCAQAGGEVLYQDASLRVVLVDDGHYPGFCRVILQDHVAEMTDLSPLMRQVMMNVVWQVELAVRDVMQPDKINLAAFGNMVPHLHWHVIPRYRDDVHFPAPVWGQAQRAADAQAIALRRALLPQLRERLQNLQNA